MLSSPVILIGVLGDESILKFILMLNRKIIHDGNRLVISCLDGEVDDDKIYYIYNTEHGWMICFDKGRHNKQHITHFGEKIDLGTLTEDYYLSELYDIVDILGEQMPMNKFKPIVILTNIYAP